MSWKASMSRYVPIMRFFACRRSPSSRGVINWYNKNYQELKALNPSLPLLLRTTENAMPAITTEIDFTIDDLLRYMIQSGRFRDTNGTIASDRVDAAKAYLKTDWPLLRWERWSSPGFDPEKPYLDEDDPEWRSNPKIAKDLTLYLQLKDAVDEQVAVFTGGPNDEYTRSKNALLMCQRVDLWCAGEAEVECAVRHLVKLGERFNADLEFDKPQYISEFYPGVGDL